MGGERGAARCATNALEMGSALFGMVKSFRPFVPPGGRLHGTAITAESQSARISHAVASATADDQASRDPTGPILVPTPLGYIVAGAFLAGCVLYALSPSKRRAPERRPPGPTRDGGAVETAARHGPGPMMNVATLSVDDSRANDGRANTRVDGARARWRRPSRHHLRLEKRSRMGNASAPSSGKADRRATARWRTGCRR